MRTYCLADLFLATGVELFAWHSSLVSKNRAPRGPNGVNIFATFSVNLCYNSLMYMRALPIVSLSSVAILLVMLNFTTPSGIGPVGVLLFFCLVYLVMLGVMTGVVMLFRRITGKKDSVTHRDRLYGAILAFAPIMLLLAQSLGSISVLTIALVVIFVSLGCFLVAKR